MAFNVQSWGRMSSSCNNKITTLQDGNFVGAPNLFTYASSTDTVATIAAADYFAAVVAELNVGDDIYVVGSDTQTHLSVVTAVLYPASVTTQQSVSIGDVDGPAVATDNALARFDGTTGKLIQNGVILESDLGDLTLVRTIQNAVGTGALPSYTFTGDTDTGMWHSAANTLDFSTNAFRGFQVAAAPALSVDFLSVIASATNAANAALQPSLVASGTDAVIDVAVVGKGATGGLAVLPSSTGAAGSIKLWNGAGTFYTMIQGAAVAANLTYTWSLAAPTVNDQVPTFTTAGVMSFSPVTISSAGVVSSVTQLNVDNLRLDGNTISSTNAGGDILLLPDTTGHVEISSNATKAGILRFKEPVASGTNYVAFQAPALAGDTTYQLPNAFPAVAGYVLSSDLTGTMSWVPNGSKQWVDQTTTPVTMVANTGYSANNAGLVTLNLPALAAFGDEFHVVGQGAGGWLLQAAGGQTINFGSSATSVAGSLASTNRYDSVHLVCTVANTTFVAIASIGNLTVA